jgi:methanethiol oxidase
MIGAATGTTQPGGIVAIDDETGAFQAHFGPPPVRDPADPGPNDMYGFDGLSRDNNAEGEVQWHT